MDDDATGSRATKPHWYFIGSFYCPVCGHTTTYRERRYDARPERYEDRHEVTEVWDYCDVLCPNG